MFVAFDNLLTRISETCDLNYRISRAVFHTFHAKRMSLYTRAKTPDIPQKLGHDFWTRCQRSVNNRHSNCLSAHSHSWRPTMKRRRSKLIEFSCHLTEQRHR